MMRTNYFLNQIKNLPKNVALVFSLCFVINIIQAQENHFELKWSSSLKNVEVPEGNFLRPEFTDAIHNKTENFFPTFTTSFYTKNEASAAITNAKYEAVDSATALLLSDISTEPKIEINNGKTALRNIAIVKIFPFRKNESSGAIEKLVSFNIQLADAVLHSNKSAQRGTNAYAANSVLASGKWFRISTDKTSMFKLTYSFLKSKLGIEPSNISFSTFGVFGNYHAQLNETAGQEPKADDLLELPIYIFDKNGNGKFDTDDFVLFYGESADAWNYPGDQKPFVHSKNIYADKNYYFITTEKGSGKQAVDENFTGVANQTVNTFNDFAFHELDEKNLLESGRLWLGNKMSATSTTVNVDFSFPNIVTSTPVNIVSVAAARTPQTTASGATQISCSTQGSALFNHSINGSGAVLYGTVAYSQTIQKTFSPTSDNFKLTYSYSSIDNTGEAYIDYIEANCLRNLIFTGSSMNFRNVGSIAPSAISQFEIGNANGAQVWDVTNPYEARKQTLNNGTFTVATSTLKEFVAFKSDAAFPEPEFVEETSNQNLHNCGQPDMVIVTYPDFIDAANRLADFHRTQNNISVVVTTPQTIYNEFSSGKQDATAIRNFMKMLYDNAAGDSNKIPRYLLLFGDGSFDMKNRISPSTNFIPTYQSYESFAELWTFVSDDFYGLLDDGEGGNILGSNNFIDVAIGRLPVGSADEADGVVTKIINYKSTNTLGNWRNRITFVADDEDGNTHLYDCNGYADYLATTDPIYNQNKIYLDAYQRVNTPAGARYPAVNDAILNSLNRGTLLLNWVGHGSVTNWAHERVFNLNDIQQLTNFNTLPLFVTATCEFSMFDRSGGQTAGENLIVNPKGGGIGAITTVRVVWSNENKVLNTALIKNVFNPYRGKMPTMGELLMQAKNSIWAVNDVNNRKFLLLGDPALTLNYPELNVVTTEVNGVPTNLSNDTMKALQQITMQGEVHNWDGSLANDFNGFVYPTVFDKVSTLTTLSNSPSSPKATFKLYNSIVFNGKASVQNGKFSFSFMVPKDIDYKIGNARISYYAEDPSRNIDAHGLDNDVYVGESVDSIAFDDQGPTISLFMNDTNFIHGGITDANPKLLALLEDDFGINVGNSLGHEITAILDENSAKPIILNDYFESELNSYKKGSVFYPLHKLEDGPHTLTVKAWDTQNNSAEASISFVVGTSPSLVLNKIFCYPNPFSTSTTFSFEHNYTDKPLDVDVKIYSLNGSLVRNIRSNFTPSGYRETGIKWEGDTDEGGSVMKGVYIYRITLKDQDGNQTSKTDRVVVIR
ncbi:MAG TPA: type IX secretion system sortase PorU [Chitinophagales bacterium]|nr:type IX secretion system sortase PorU [Chitinophagales bacterium]